MAETLSNLLVELFKNKIPEELTVFIISLLPILELRGGLIAAKILDMNYFQAFAICFIGNLLPVPFILLFIRKIFDFLRRFKFCEKIVNKLEMKSVKNREKVMKYQAWGLLLFVAIPFPGTGAWTGSLIAAMLDIRMKRAIPIIVVGVLIAGIIMSVLTYGVFGLIGN